MTLVAMLAGAVAGTCSASSSTTSTRRASSMGNSGSYFLGYVVSTTALIGATQEGVRAVSPARPHPGAGRAHLRHALRHGAAHPREAQHLLARSGAHSPSPPRHGAHPPPGGGDHLRRVRRVHRGGHRRLARAHLAARRRALFVASATLIELVASSATSTPPPLPAGAGAHPPRDADCSAARCPSCRSGSTGRGPRTSSWASSGASPTRPSSISSR